MISLAIEFLFKILSGCNFAREKIIKQTEESVAMAKYLVTYLAIGGQKRDQIDADHIDQSGNLAVIFWKKNDLGRSEEVAAYAKDKFVSAVRQEN